MNAERWRQVDRIFHDALEQAANERRQFVQSQCEGDPWLAEEVQALIDSYDEAGNFLQPSSPSLVGQTFSSYQVQELIGAGSMGEVYLARDSKLKRDVAIKVLPETFSRDAERVARFQREAEILASLNHPNIASIYDLQKISDTRLIVLELVDGETLDKRLERGAIPLEEALRIAAQLADALQAAHEKGITHRDLKPSNIKITSNSTVKVLDFGIAKVPAAEDAAPPEFMTPSEPGSILGTAAYMSPEQANAKDTDRTSDVWSFGCVLYEMLTGRRAFEGDTTSSVHDAVLKAEPDWQRLPPQTPEAIHRLLRRCLRRDRKLRLHDMADAHIEIDEAQTELQNPAAPINSTPRSERLIWISAIIVLSMISALAIRRDMRGVHAEPERRLELAALPTAARTSFAISPDGQKIVFEATLEGHSSLWLMPLDSGVARPIRGTESGRTYLPFWAPDSQSIGFFAYAEDTKLQRIDIRNESVQTLATIGTTASGGTWGTNGVILFGVGGAILSVAETGGAPAAVLETPQAIYTAPHFLPGGRKFLYNASGRQPEEPSGVYIADLDGTAPRRIVEADAGAEYSSGRLFFVNQGTLFAQSFDPDRAELTGERTPIAEHVTVLGPKAAISVSAAGPIIYRTGTTDPDAQLAWFDRSGKEIQTVGEPFTPGFGLALSPDGRFVAYVRQNGKIWTVWLHDLNRNVTTPFASDGAEPAWSPDGSRIVYCKSGATAGVFQKPVATDGSEEFLAGAGVSPDWSASGYVLFNRMDKPAQPQDLWAVRLNSTGKAAGQIFPLIQTPSDERAGKFSPDGKWIAYSSNKSGRREIYMRSFTGKGPEVQLSINGGVQVRWRRDGHEVFYLAPDGRLMAVQVKITSGGIEPSPPVPLFLTHAFGTFESFSTTYVASADGQRFLVLTSEDAMSPAPIKLVLNWRAQDNVRPRQKSP